MIHYDEHLTIKEALPIYFSKYHFEYGGYTKKWFSIKLGPIYIPFPNIKDRVDAVKIHDVHHILTGYTADYYGEAQIGAWELSRGCDKYYMAWILNLGSFFIGMIICPGLLYKAFMEGRKFKSNLYHNVTYNDDLLNKTIKELREELLDANTVTKTADRWHFAGFTLITLLSSILFFYGLFSLTHSICNFTNCNCTILC